MKGYCRLMDATHLRFLQVTKFEVESSDVVEYFWWDVGTDFIS